MSLSDLASLGSFVSGVAVLISLIYLALQVRQAERNQRALAQQMRATRTSELLIASAQPEIAEMYTRMYRRGEPQSETEVGQFTRFMRAGFYGFEDAFLQHKSRLIDRAAYGSAVGAMRMVFSAPGPRIAWLMQRSTFDSGFAKFVDDLISSTPLSPTSDEMAAWRAALSDMHAAASLPRSA